MQNYSISITNFWWGRKNYGAVLTAFALQEILRKNFKCDVNLINNISIEHYISTIKYDKLNKFQKNKLLISKIINNLHDFQYVTERNDTFITGSDQVFRPKVTRRNKIYQYFLDFVAPNKKKFSFSASFGVDKERYIKENDKETLEKIKQSLQSFDFISVREKSGVEICKDLFDVEAEWIIDPVFILDKSVYENLAGNSQKNYQNKIVSYILNSDNNAKFTKQYETKYNCKINELACSKSTIEDWLCAIMSCELLITDSFHGMCFAIIFNKPFIGICNSLTGSARYEAIFEMLGIENQLVDYKTNIVGNDHIFKIDYEKVNQNIEKERQRGLEFLKRALEAEPTKYEEKKIVYERCVAEMEAEKKKYLKHIKEFFWLCWLFIVHNILSEGIKNKIRELRDRKRGNN